MDIYHNYGNDVVIAPNGDQLLVDGHELTKQRIFRRLLTNAKSYIWQPTYGAGVPKDIGKSLSSQEFNKIKSNLISQILMEDAVAKTPAPTIDEFKVDGLNTLFCQITYYDAINQQPFTLSFTVSNTNASSS